MTLRDILDQCVTVEGWIKVQCWKNDKPVDKPVICYEGYGLNHSAIEKYLDRDIIYIFPYMVTNNEAAICIELEEERC